MPTHTSISRMLIDLKKYGRNHPGARILSQDDVLRRVIQFIAYPLNVGDYVEFSIRLSDLRKTGRYIQDEYEHLILTASGRIQLAAMFEVPASFDFEAHHRQPTFWVHLLEDNGL